jgi:methylaspartate mutase sigma subunit
VYNANEIDVRTEALEGCVNKSLIRRKKMKNHNLNIILTGTPSDSHIWNLIFMELFLQERHYRVHNLGACVPTTHLQDALKKLPCDLVVISSINGHLFQDAIKIISSFPKHSFSSLPPFILGGKMGIVQKDAAFQKRKLLKLGYDGVFIEKNALENFAQYLDRLASLKHQSLLQHAV